MDILCPICGVNMKRVSEYEYYCANDGLIFLDKDFKNNKLREYIN